MTHVVRASGRGGGLQLPGPPPEVGPVRRWILAHLATLEISSFLGATCLPAVIAFLVIRSQAGTLSGRPVIQPAPASTESIADEPLLPSPDASFGNFKSGVASVRIVSDGIHEPRTRVRIEIENVLPHLKVDDFEFARLECELSDNYGNSYRAVPPSDMLHGMYDRRPLYPHERRAIDVEFDRPVPGIQWLELRMPPPTRRTRKDPKLRFGIPASLITGLEKVAQSHHFTTLGCE